MESDETDARAQLAALHADRVALAERAVQPWWYDALLGLLVAGFISSYASRDGWVVLAAFLLLGFGLSGLMAVYRRLTGMWVSGLRPGPTQRAVRVWMSVYGVVVATAAVAEFLLDVRGAMVVGGVVVGLALALISRWWTRLYVAELRGGL